MDVAAAITLEASLHEQAFREAEEKAAKAENAQLAIEQSIVKEQEEIARAKKEREEKLQALQALQEETQNEKFSAFQRSKSAILKRQLEVQDIGNEAEVRLKAALKKQKRITRVYEAARKKAAMERKPYLVCRLRTYLDLN